MSVALIKKYVGEPATLTVLLSLSVPIEIKDVKEVFGRVDLLVTPVGGSGEKWVSSDSVVMKGK